MRFTGICLLMGFVALVSTGAGAADSRIRIYADRVTHRISPYLTGACIEDVNHEVYGGIDSQLIFGESFAEPVPLPPLKGLTAYGGHWVPQGDTLLADGGSGPKLLVEDQTVGDAAVSVDLRFPESAPGNAGLIVKVSQAGVGADKFNGYEVSLEPSGHLVLGRHRQNWEPLRNIRCNVPTKQWITLAVRMTATTLEIFVDGKSLLNFEDTEHPLQPGQEGRFKALPVRNDVAQGLTSQGVTVLRQGGCMVNAAEYRWKKMIGPRALRPPYKAFWHPH